MPGFTTDKVTPHGYLTDYLKLAARAGTHAVVCEVGVKHGESLVLWQHLMPHGLVIGVDYDETATWPDGTVRIIADQAAPDLPGLVRQYAPDGCDLIVEDASHKAHLTAATFGLLWPLVKPGGCYVVEDWADPWIDPALPRWDGDELVDYVPSLVAALKDGADTVTYTREGLVIIRRRA